MKTLLTVKVIASQGFVKVEVSGDDQQPENIRALLLCYAAKIRWLIVSEPSVLLTVFRNIFNQTFAKWPNIPAVDMLASLNKNPSIFVVNLNLGRISYSDPNRIGYSIENILPDTCQSNDIVTHYFFLLKELLARLDDKNVEVCKTALYTFTHKWILNDANLPDSVESLVALNGEANRILDDSRIQEKMSVSAPTVSVANSVAKLDKQIEKKALNILFEFIPEDTWGILKDKIEANPKGWAQEMHLGFGMKIRNILRMNDVLDKDSPTGSLDDIWPELARVAVYSENKSVRLELPEYLNYEQNNEHFFSEIGKNLSAIIEEHSGNFASSLNSKIPVVSSSAASEEEIKKETAIFSAWIITTILSNDRGLFSSIYSALLPRLVDGRGLVALKKDVKLRNMAYTQTFKAISGTGNYLPLAISFFDFLGQRIELMGIPTNLLENVVRYFGDFVSNISKLTAAPDK